MHSAVVTLAVELGCGFVERGRLAALYEKRGSEQREERGRRKGQEEGRGRGHFGYLDDREAATHEVLSDFRVVVINGELRARGQCEGERRRGKVPRQV
jgi:hypothetical protein